MENIRIVQKGDGSAVCCVFSSDVEGTKIEIVDRSSHNEHPFLVEDSSLHLMNATLIVENKEISSPSLVGSPKEHENRYSKRTSSTGMLIVEQSLFSSISVSSPPFLSSPSLTEINVGNSIFCNISSCKHHILPNSYGFHRLQTRAESCSFASVHDAFDGGVFESVNSPGASFQSSNNSFMNCAKTSFSGNSNMERKTFDGGSHSFSNCEWHNTKTENVWEGNVDWDLSICGGAIGIHGNPTTNVEINQCVFDNCSCGRYGGAVMVFHAGNTYMDRMKGENCSGGSGAFGMLNDLIDLRIANSNFKNCSVSDFGALRLQSFNVIHSENELTVPV
eukprot:MONOS_16718.1-p1 / transcript=MONOS_16718.1 / gene=MONOS_16718 / organism=Monocercomonoides_exilis_PA203 / gene_product=unspecified product / transcript_product=unspecified product / location=Mono_scaffold02061:1117-2115(+) / protein_length=333 / sequence_SO=supercontig / SO=protein_coding / is_pseudo=false